MSYRDTRRLSYRDRQLQSFTRQNDNAARFHLSRSTMIAVFYAVDAR